MSSYPKFLNRVGLNYIKVRAFKGEKNKFILEARSLLTATGLVAYTGVTFIRKSIVVVKYMSLHFYTQSLTFQIPAFSHSFSTTLCGTNMEQISVKACSRRKRLSRKHTKRRQIYQNTQRTKNTYLGQGVEYSADCTNATVSQYSSSNSEEQA